MEPILIGYFPKRVAVRPDWLNAAGVKEVCSVSECVSGGPEEWLTRWAHNDLFLYDSEGLGWSVVPDAESRADYQMFTYRLYPVHFDDGEERPFAIPPLAVQPLSPGYRRLGCDIVSRSHESTFGCSPLSCNGAAEEVAVNEFCLVDDPAKAFRLAALFSRTDEGYEPGPYHVVEVWRHFPLSGG